MDHYYIHPVNLIIIFKKLRNFPTWIYYISMNEGKQKKKSHVYLGNPPQISIYTKMVMEKPYNKNIKKYIKK